MPRGFQWLNYKIVQGLKTFAVYLPGTFRSVIFKFSVASAKAD